jgi:hypothetical protein
MGDAGSGLPVRTASAHADRRGKRGPRGDFDPQVMAIAIRAAIDAVPPRLARDPGFDVGHYGRELANLFDAATQNEKGDHHVHHHGPQN